MSNNPVCWFEIYVQDMARARAFYESVFSVTLEPLDNPDLELWAFPANMAGAGAGGALVRMPGLSSGGNSTIVYFACDDCAVEEARVRECGGRIQRSKTSIGEYGFMALAIDTEGNMFGLHSMQ